MLTIQCPHCTNVEEDTFEVLDANFLHEMTCSECMQAFATYIFDCEGCGNEETMVWKKAPSRDGIAQLSCPACGRSWVPEQVGIEDGRG